ncbi:MAG: hypothetical protein ACJAXJ_003918 [Colwellia sp.]|jgi:hypothetical protein
MEPTEIEEDDSPISEKPYRMIYMEDPFGNILEIYSHSYELTYPTIGDILETRINDNLQVLNL